MSIFTVQDFWSFDLDSLATQFSSATNSNLAADGAAHVSEEKTEADFVVAIGKFHSVGPYDVFVAANLDGFLCIIQVPEGEQLKQVNQKLSKNSLVSDRNKAQGDRQLLLAKQLEFPVVDIKCGYFTSALKHSIAVLSFDKLVLYQFKRHQLDLISSEQTISQNFPLTLNEDLFSHKLEEHCRFDLLRQELASNIVILDKHADACFTQTSSGRNRSESQPIDHQIKGFLPKRNKQSYDIQQLHLPQRDTIVVQYSNQFIFTIIEHKKIVGSFSISEVNTNYGEDLKENVVDHELQLEQLSQYVGSMPMAFLNDSKTPSLVVSLSDNRIFSLTLSKLTALAKQNVVKRVAHNLLHDKDSHTSEKRASLTYCNPKIVDEETKIDINLQSVADWEFELVHSPIQIQSVRLLAKNSLSNQSEIQLCQLIVMSRYNLDLFSSSGEHLWSQRFETPLICIEAFTLEQQQSELQNEKHSEQNVEKLLSLLCTDCLGDDKCNLIVLDEDHVVWSALLNRKPAQLWRINLSNMSGVIAALDRSRMRLSIGYLGTNTNSDGDEYGEKEDSSSQIVQLDCLDSPLFEEDQTRAKVQNDNFSEYTRKLCVNVDLEASNQWPQVRVESRISIRSESISSGILHDIVAVMQFDDLLNFESTHPFSIISEGVVQLQLGSYWPDRCEPIGITGHFSMRSRSLSLIDQDQLESQHDQVPDSANYALKSLKVNLYLKFNEARCGHLVQEESFLLPLNLIAQLVHIDYSSGQNQSLDDVQANLSSYKRQSTNYTGHSIDTKSVESPYFLCDLFIKTHSDIIEMIDDIIEGDLVCRGLNPESIKYKIEIRKERKHSTIENLDLLAQSLDCRLRYKSQSHPKRITSEENPLVVMVSIALKVPVGVNVTNNVVSSCGDDEPSFTTIWLHLCDLSAIDSTIPEELTKQHLEEWKSFDVEFYDNKPSLISNSSGCPILISIECEHPIPVLFLQDHLLERLKKRANTPFNLQPLAQSVRDNIEIDHHNIFKLNNFIATSVNLHDELKSFLENYENYIVVGFKNLKEELGKEYCKFHISTMTSLSTSKQLFSLPDSMHKQFNSLCLLTRHHQLTLMKILNELEKLKEMDYLYSKIPSSNAIVIQGQEGKILNWPNFLQIID